MRCTKDLESRGQQLLQTIFLSFNMKKTQNIQNMFDTLMFAAYGLDKNCVKKLQILTIFTTEMRTRGATF